MDVTTFQKEKTPLFEWKNKDHTLRMVVFNVFVNQKIPNF